MQFAVHGQCVVNANIERRTQTDRAVAYISAVLELVQVLEIIAQAFPFV